MYMEKLINDLRQREDETRLGGEKSRIGKEHAKEKLTP